MEINKIGIVIQARTGSSRLPNKMTLPFYKEQSIPELIIKRLQNRFEYPVVLATTDKQQDDKLSDLSSELNIHCYRGSENNVLDRFIKVADEFGFHYVVRVCADNPFLDPARLVELVNSDFTRFDYVSHCLNDGTPAVLTHFGFFGELVSVSALKEVSRLTSDAIYLEHVTNYIYRNKDEFTSQLLRLPSEYDDLKDQVRLTIDTREDFDLVAKLFEKLSVESVDSLSSSDVLSAVRRDAGILSVMKKQISRNTK